MDDAWIERLVRATQWDPDFSALPVDRHHDRAFVPSRTLVTINAASLLHEPFSKCFAYHPLLLSMVVRSRCSRSHRVVAAAMAGLPIIDLGPCPHPRRSTTAAAPNAELQFQEEM